MGCPWRSPAAAMNRLFHLIDQGLNGLISFTKVPMRICLFSGSALATASLL
jgi:hypothetical protein